MASIYDANTNYTVNGTDLRYNPGMVTREYLIDVYPTLVDNFRFAGLWLWGENDLGQLGVNDIINRSSPVQTISGGTDWKQVSGGTSTTAAIKTNGTLWLWGRNEHGQLGVNDRIHRSSPVQTISGGTDWKQVSCGGTFIAAIKTTGTLWLWGENFYGQLGTNNRTYNSSPVQTIAGGTNWKQVSCGASHAAAIKNDGTLWLWGKNTPSGFSGGQLGDNTLLHRSSPVQTIAGGTNWKQVSCGSEHTAAIKTDGTLWLWGSNATGGLGNGLNSDRSSPIQTVTGGTNWKQIECGQENTAAIKTDGTLWLWGFNQNGALGDNTRTHRSSPVQTVSGGTNWKQVSLGSFFTGAIKNDGTLWTWGVNTTGQLGDNTVVSKSSPVQTISTGTNWKQVICASITICIRDDSSDPFRAEPL